jgi:hypothetical protein
MPVLILPIAKDFDELLQDGGLAAIAALSKLGRVVIVTVHLSIVLVIAVLSPKHGWADGAGEVFNVVLAIKCSDIRPAKSATALEAQKIQSSEIIGLAKWELSRAIGLVDWEKFGCHDLTAVCALEAVKMEGAAEGPDELSSQTLPALPASS